MIIILQGRLRSTRLPAKGFFTFFGQTIWERMCDIALAVSGVDEVVFATGSKYDNDIIKPIILKKGVRWFVGPEDDVLKRYILAMDGYKGKYLLRITCDNYLIQPDLLEAVYEATSKTDADYGYIAPLSHYAGEVVKCSTLRIASANNYSIEAKEHVTWDIRNNDLMSKVVLQDDYMGVNHRRSVTLDTIDDFHLMKKLEYTYPGLKHIRCLDELSKIEPFLNCHEQGMLYDFYYNRINPT